MNHKLMLLSGFAGLWLSACQIGIEPAPIATSSPTPSATPSVTPSVTPTAVPTASASPDPLDGRTEATIFSTYPSWVCPGDELTVRVERSDYNRGNLPLVFQLRSKLASGTPKPQSDFTTDFVLLGQLPISPQGTGQFRFTLQPSYLTRSGARLDIASADALALYFETSPGNYVQINDVSICPYGQPGGPNAADGSPMPAPGT